ncbi:MAG: hypothetical protein JSS95_08275 [Acidobacteria bacterium]|nr:hypothetical protein [Acidobacteriota bacterium]
MSDIITFLVKWAIGFCTLILIFLLYVVFGDMPFGIQLVTLIAYSIVVFFSLFCDSKLGKGFDFYGEAREKSTSRLLTIHSSFLILVFTIQTLTFSLKPKLPHWWTYKSNPTADSRVEVTLCLLIIALVTTQVIWSRRILSKAEKETISPK